MPRTVSEYQQRWQDATSPDCTYAPWDEPFAPTACVLYETAHAAPLGEGCMYLPDFGDAICFYRHLRIPHELDIVPAEGLDVAALLPDLERMGWSWSRSRSRFSTEEIRRRRYEGERALDKLLARFVREGYQPEMGAKLIEIVRETLIDFELLEVYVLPGDLDKLLARFGNPLLGCFSCADKSLDEAAIPAFDLNVRGHREALAEYLVACGR